MSEEPEKNIAQPNGWLDAAIQGLRDRIKDITTMSYPRRATLNALLDNRSLTSVMLVEQSLELSAQSIQLSAQSIKLEGVEKRLDNLGGGSKWCKYKAFAWPAAAVLIIASVILGAVLIWGHPENVAQVSTAASKAATAERTSNQ